MQDQHSHWNALHQRNQSAVLHSGPSSLARECASLIPAGASLLELGCGPGHDARYFAALGHTVLATDFSEDAIAANHSQPDNPPNLQFARVDTVQPLPFDDHAFDVVYTRLSLHYFTDRVTRAVFREIHRVLTPDGLLCFLCKSEQDPLYGKGRQLEPDMFELGGHVRHFFSEIYCTACLAPAFDILHLSRDSEPNAGPAPYDHSAFIKAIARPF
jgi:SAM-dependent methyltransferase